MRDTSTAPARYDVAVVGGGFSGLMVALNAARCEPAGVRIVIIERRDAVGRGTAYARRPREVILNVSAGAMGAFADAPGDFVRWLGDADPAAFIPRHRYGDYLQSLLIEARAAGHIVDVVHGDVADVTRDGSGYVVRDAAGHALANAPLAVLALGAPPPADLIAHLPPGVRAHRGYIADPWTFVSAPTFIAGRDVLVAGTGLTALDVIATFARANDTVRLHAVSRRGRYPFAHAAIPAPPIAPLRAPLPSSVRDIVAAVRRSSREARERQADWRSVIDGVRPIIADLWNELDDTERRRYLRHVRPIFDPQRHRAPAALLARCEQLRAAGRLVTHAGRIREVRTAGDALEATIEPRGGGPLTTLVVGQIINCTGPAADYGPNASPLVRALLARGTVTADATGLGLRVLRDGRLVDAAGSPHADLFTIGWPSRGTFLEATAVRELREHAAALGARVAALSAERQRAATPAGAATRRSRR